MKGFIMSIELMTLVLCALLCLALPLFYSSIYAQQVGFKTVAGNRDGAPEPSGIAGRGQRAHRNLIENLVPYAAVILVAHLHGVSNSYTVVAALVFLAARVIHALGYIGGVTGVRTLAWNVGVVATIVIGVQALIH